MAVRNAEVENPPNEKNASAIPMRNLQDPHVVASQSAMEFENLRRFTWAMIRRKARMLASGTEA